MPSADELIDEWSKDLAWSVGQLSYMRTKRKLRKRTLTEIQSKVEKASEEMSDLLLKLE